MILRALDLRTLLTLAAFVLTLVGARHAHADVAVLVPPHVEQLPSSDVLEQASEELTRLLKLQGFDVISSGQSGPAAEAEQQRGVFPPSYDPLFCVTPECANEYRKLFDAIFAVQLIIQARAQKATSVSIVLTESPKSFFNGVAPIEGRDVRAAVRSAFEAARQKQEEGAGPWLTVQGTPKGAQVLVDGVEYGRVPFTKRHIESGMHKLEVKDERYLVEQRSLNVPSQIDHIELVDVQLEPLDASAIANESARPSRIHRSPWDYVLGGALIAVGTLHVIDGAYQKAKAGDCSSRVNDVCTEHYSKAHGTRENVMIGLGAAGIALGATVMALGPIGYLQVRGGADHAMLQLKGNF